MIVDTTVDSRIMQEEIFGPVVAAMPFADIDEIAAQANDAVYGLAAGGVWTRDISKAHKLAKRIKAGQETKSVVVAWWYAARDGVASGA